VLRDAAVRERIAPLRHHLVEVGMSPGRGRGVFARSAIAPATLIEAAPVIVLPAAECPALDRTVIYEYYFHWDGDPDGEGRGALGLGLVTLCNHSPRPCARVERNYANLTLDLVAICPIQPGEEITIDYGCTLWFAPRG
jgi:SET domain-containing protein